MTFTKHGHPIPRTAVYMKGFKPPNFPCGGFPFCEECGKDAELVMDVDANADCVIDKDPKIVELDLGEPSSGDIPWCSVHHCEPSQSGEICVLKEEYLKDTPEESVPNILRSISENFEELAEAFLKLSNILEDKEK